MDKKEIFVRKAIKKHGDKYDYSKVEYKIFLKEKIYTDKNELIKTIFTA